MSASRSASSVGAGRRAGPAGIGLVAVLLGTAAPGWADTPSVRVGALELTPIALVQLDGGSTFNEGQGTGVNLRRGRVGGSAKLAEDVKASVIWDFGGPPGRHSSLHQADIAYSGPLPLAARAGVFKAPFTLEYAQGAGDILFLERASIATLVTGLVAGGGRVGGQLGGTGERWFASVFLTGGKTGSGARSDQRAVLGRAAGLVVQTDSVSVHLGASGAWLYQVARAGDGSRTLRLSDQPEIQLDMAPASLTSGAVPATGARLGGVEAGMSWDRLWLQAEGYAITLDGIGPGRSPTSAGGYVQAATILTGTPRRWSPGIAAWARPKAKSAWDTVEAGTRFSYAEVKGLAGQGGRQSVWSANLSWYPLDPLRLVLEYGHARVQGGAAPRTLDFVATRAQLAF